MKNNKKLNKRLTVLEFENGFYTVLKSLIPDHEGSFLKEEILQMADDSNVDLDKLEVLILKLDKIEKGTDFFKDLEREKGQ